MSTGRDRWLFSLEDRLAKAEETLLVEHRASRDLADFQKYRGQPLAFFRDELGFIPYAKQVAVVEAFERDRRTAARGCHGAGKDAVVAALALYAAYCLGMLVLIISATERQVVGQTWREVRQRFSARLPGALFTTFLRIRGEPRILCMTSATISNLTGWHDPNGVAVFISEGQAEGVEGAAYDAALANAVDDRSRVLAVGNPIRAAGRFYEVSNKPTWRAIAISAFDHPNVVEQREVIPGGPAPGWPAEMAAEFGEDSAWYISRVLGEFPAEGTVDALFKRVWLEAAYARHEAGVALKGWPVPLVALDVARSHERDESVAALVQGTVVHRLWPWRVRDLTVTADKVLELTERARLEWYLSSRRATAAETAVTRDPDQLAAWLDGMGAAQFELVVDAAGIGGGPVDDLKRRGRPVTEWWGWNPAANERRFANKRAEGYWHMRTLAERGRLVMPRDAKLGEECMAMLWSQDTKGKIVMLSKDELRKELKRSPDRLDAVVMGLATAERLGVPGVSFFDVAM
jgi:hypothetical protein